jgi:zinc protease
MKRCAENFRENLSVFALILFILTAAQFSPAQKPTETPPPPGEPRSLTVPQVNETVLDNGLKVVVVPKKNLPLVTVSLLVKSGSETEAVNKAGLANMTADLLTKGTEFRNATEIAEQIDFLGGNLQTSGSWNYTTVTLSIMKDKLGKALAIMSDTVVRPNFPEKELQLAKKQTLDGFAVSLQQPGTLLGYVASRYTYDEHPSVGTRETIGRIRRNDVFGFHKDHYLPENSVLIFTGDITSDQAFRFAKLFFGGWQKSPNTRKDFIAALLPTLPAPEMSQQDKVIKRMLVIDLPDSGQAAVGYAKKLENGRVNCSDGDCTSSETFFPASVLNSVLGGGYSARLNQEIRLKRGLSYGARSGFNWRGRDANFNANTQTKNESAAEVAELIKIEIEKLAAESISTDEMMPRKAVIIGAFGRELQSNEGLAGALRTLYLYGLSPENLNSFIADVREVSDEDVQNFAAANLLGGDLIIVGDAKLFMDDLKKRFPGQTIEVIKAADLDLNSDSLRKRGTRAGK